MTFEEVEIDSSSRIEQSERDKSDRSRDKRSSGSRDKRRSRERRSSRERRDRRSRSRDKRHSERNDDSRRTRDDESSRPRDDESRRTRDDESRRPRDDESRRTRDDGSRRPRDDESRRTTRDDRTRDDEPRRSRDDDSRRTRDKRSRSRERSRYDRDERKSSRRWEDEPRQPRDQPTETRESKEPRDHHSTREIRESSLKRGISPIRPPKSDSNTERHPSNIQPSSKFAIEEKPKTSSEQPSSKSTSNVKPAAPLAAPKPTTVPLHLRERKFNNWDTAPEGYDGMSVVQVKMTGHFPPPGQPSRSLTQMAALPAHLLPGFTLPTGETPSSVHIAQFFKQARRIYVQGLPRDLTEKMVIDFFNDTMKNAHMTVDSGNPCTGVELDNDNHFAFVEFRTAEEATTAMSLTGIRWKKSILKTKRPKEYIAPGMIEFIHVLYLDGTVDSPHKVSISGIPMFLNQEQIADLFQAYGDLKYFNLSIDPDTKLSKGEAVCEYVDSSITDIACQGLNGMEFDEDKLVVQRSTIAVTKSMNVKPLPVGAHSTACIVHVLPTHLLYMEPEDLQDYVSPVVILLNMIDPEDVEDMDEEFLNDIKKELSRYGNLVGMKIPKPPRPESGKIFLQYETNEMALKAVEGLAGRTFLRRTLCTSFGTLELYHSVVEE